MHLQHVVDVVITLVLMLLMLNMAVGVVLEHLEMGVLLCLEVEEGEEEVGDNQTIQAQTEVQVGLQLVM
jgi:hypothetical protein